MRRFALLGLLILLLNVSVFAQDDGEAPAADGEGEGKEGGEEECEEAWDYVEFMKANLK